MTILNVAGKLSLVTNAGRFNDRQKRAMAHVYLTDFGRYHEKEAIKNKSITCGLALGTAVLVAPVLGVYEFKAFAVGYVGAWIGLAIWLLFVTLTSVRLWHVRRPVRQDKRMGRNLPRTGPIKSVYALEGPELQPLREACEDAWKDYSWEITICSDLGIELTGRVLKFVRELEKPALFERKLDGNREKQRKDEIKALATAAAEDMNVILTDARAHDEAMKVLNKLFETNETQAEIEAKQRLQSANEKSRNRLFDAAFDKGNRPLSQPRVVDTTG